MALHVAALHVVTGSIETPVPMPRGAYPYTPYLQSALKPGDNDDYAAAGLLAYRVSQSGSIDVLLGRQMARGKGPSRRGTWSFIGGKREEVESCSISTAARETHEESMGCLTANWVEATLRADPNVLWTPTGGYAIHLAEVVPEAGGAVADALSLLPTGLPLPLRRPPPPVNAAADESLAAARSILDQFGGGPMLLSQLTSMMYEQLPASREQVMEAGGASGWCSQNGIYTARGPRGSIGKETAWLSQKDTLEVDFLLWMPWIVLATRADYNELLQLSRVSVRVHPFFASILNAPGGKLLREHFARVASERRELIQEQKES